MTLEEKVKHWIELVDRDIVAAEIMLKNKQYLYAGFICQQAVEKILKGYFIKVRDEVHPHIHDLLKLVKLAELYEILIEEQKDFLEELNPLYIEARYNSYKKGIAETLTDESIKSIFERTKEFVLWTKEKML